MEDKDSETFDLFFHNLSVKISETFSLKNLQQQKNLQIDLSMFLTQILMIS